MNEPDRRDDDERDDEAMRALIKRSLSAELPAKGPPLVAGVQRRLRRRSRGKFFGDGWSVAQNRASYVIVAVLTIFVVWLAYFALGPLDVR
jgi:hypothetical protein